jgi:phosphate transport system substrate-binding protein
MKRFSFIFACIAVFGFALSAAAAELTISGSTTVHPVVKIAAEKFEAANPGVKIVLGAGGSGAGVKGAGSGEVMIGMASRGIKDKEKAAYPDIVATRIGLDGIGIVVNKANPVTGISSGQVQDVYTGKIANWSALGGKDAPIDLIGIELVHGTAEMFGKHFKLEAKESGQGSSKTITYTGPGGNAGPAAAAAGSNKKALAAVMTNPNAIAFASIGTAQGLAEKGSPIKLLALDGVQATVAKVADGSYPLKRPLNIVTKGKPSGDAAKFIEYLLSPEGQAIVSEVEYIPVK